LAHDAADRVRHDERRRVWLAASGITVLRVAAADVLRDETLQYVLAAIEQAAAPSGSLRSPPPPPAGEEPLLPTEGK